MSNYKMWDVIEENSLSVLLYICNMYLFVCVVVSMCAFVSLYISLSFTLYIFINIFSSDVRCYPLDPVTPVFVHCAVFGVA